MRWNFDVTTAQALFQKYGVRSDQWVEYRCLVGDPSDGISGCPRIGPQTAREIFTQVPNLDTFYRNPFGVDITAGQRTAMTNYRSDLKLVTRLITLVDSVPLPARLLESFSTVEANA